MPEAVRVEGPRDAARDGLVDRAAHDPGLAQDLAPPAGATRRAGPRTASRRGWRAQSRCCMASTPATRCAKALAAAPLPLTQVRVMSEQYPRQVAPASTSSDSAPSRRGLAPCSRRRTRRGEASPRSAPRATMFLYGVSQSSCARRAEVEEVQVELRRVASAERVAQRVVAGPRAAVRLGDARDLVRRLRDAEPVEGADAAPPDRAPRPAMPHDAPRAGSSPTNATRPPPT